MRVLALAVLVTLAPAASAQPLGPKKQAAIEAVLAQESKLIEMSDAIWEYAETALLETRSSKLLANYAEKKGFRVTRGVAGMPTAFIAEYGEGEPVLAIMGEYDALPGISQAATTEKQPLVDGGAGHGCGHNLFGAASLGAAVAIKKLIKQGMLEGTIRFYGTPAEESVGGKLYMVRDGLFRDVDVAIAWHPSSETRSDTEGSQALVDFVVEFHGTAAHAAYDPWNGRSATDALEVFTFALNQMREHVRPTVRMHYAIMNGGDVPNVVPDYAKLWCWIRDSKHEQVDQLLVRARAIAEGAALCAGVESTLTVQSGDYEFLVNWNGQHLVQENLLALGPIPFTAEEHAFARRLQIECGIEPTGLKTDVEPFLENPGEPQGGSTDVADVSWVVPTLHISVTTAPAGTPWHAWPVVAAAGTSIGHKGMMHAAQALAITLVDLGRDKELRKMIRDEFDRQTEGTKYVGYIPDGPPPVPEE